MAKLPIIAYPDPILEAKAKKIKDPKSSEINELILDMAETLDDKGVGLAAPQVGKSLRLCIIKFENKTYILINPKISSKSWKKEIKEEGCLSFPGLYLPVKRNQKITVKAQNRSGKKITLKAEGFFARVLQHEIDHLDGILFIEREAQIKPAKSFLKK